MDATVRLSKREEQISVGLVIGRCKKEIASELFISVRTVETTVKNILKKIDAKKSTEIVTHYFITHFSIPVEALPKSLTALCFLILFSIFEFASPMNDFRTRRCRRNREDYDSVCEDFDFTTPLSAPNLFEL